VEAVRTFPDVACQRRQISFDQSHNSRPITSFFQNRCRVTIAEVVTFDANKKSFYIII
jgi:hypothetical protein